MDSIAPLFAGLTGLDYVVIALVGLFAISGLMRGFTQEALSLSGWIAAILVVRFLHEPATAWATPKTGGEASAAILSFIILFFGTIIAGRAIASAAGGFARRSAIGPLDRLLGGGFGAVKGVILASAGFLLLGFATSVFSDTRSAPAWMATSRSTPLLRLTSAIMVGWVKEADLNAPEFPDMPILPGMPPEASPRERLRDERDLPPGHPAENQTTHGGYAPADREALDALLDKAAQAGEEVRI